jgi:hypothetical protein
MRVGVVGHHWFLWNGKIRRGAVLAESKETPALGSAANPVLS